MLTSAELVERLNDLKDNLMPQLLLLTARVVGEGILDW